MKANVGCCSSDSCAVQQAAARLLVSVTIYNTNVTALFKYGIIWNDLIGCKKKKKRVLYLRKELEVF